jgi:hypothetical protein
VLHVSDPQFGLFKQYQQQSSDEWAFGDITVTKRNAKALHDTREMVVGWHKF